MEAVNPYESPKSNPVTHTSDQTYLPKIFAVNGRIGRLRYLAYGMFITGLTLIIVGMLSAIMVPMFAGSGMSESMAIGAVIILYLPLIIISVILAKRRLNDLNKSGWWQLIAIIPLVGIIFTIYMVFWPGTKGSNNYGLEPIKNTKGVILAGSLLPVIAFIGILAAIALPAYQDYVERAQQAMESQN